MRRPAERLKSFLQQIRARAFVEFGCRHGINRHLLLGHPVGVAVNPCERRTAPAILRKPRDRIVRHFREKRRHDKKDTGEAEKFHPIRAYDERRGFHSQGVGKARERDRPNAASESVGSGYSIATKYNPSGGIVGPDADGSRCSKILGTSSGGIAPRPISNSVPTILRTM